MRVGARWRRCASAVAAVLLALTLSSCGAGYALRAAYEEARLLWRRQPIDEVLAKGDVDLDTRAKLELTLAVRSFAADQLGLNVGGSYQSMATVDASQIVHVVSAAPRDRLEPYTWWFPIVGRVPYRAYFDPDDANALAAELQAEGYDTYVRPAVAFSTLGWFDDPLLSTLLRYDRERLVETVIHELLHSTLYVPGQAAFNESFATFVGHRGSEQFFRTGSDAERAKVAADRWADAQRFSVFLGEAIARLEAAYRNGIDLATRAELFAAIQRDASEQPWLTDEYARFAQQPLNNAVILHDQLYADRLRLFEDALHRHGGDLRATIAWIRSTIDSHGDPYVALQTAVGPRPTAALRLDRLQLFDADADRPDQNERDDRHDGGERRDDADLGRRAERDVAEPAREDRVDRPRFQHHDGADERHA
jgi:predicted aminopeptidase